MDCNWEGITRPGSRAKLDLLTSVTMKFSRYRAPSLKTVLGVTHAKKGIKTAVGITAAMWQLPCGVSFEAGLWVPRYNSFMTMSRRKPNMRGLFWLTMGVLFFVVLAMSFLGMLGHIAFGTPIMGTAIVTAVSAILVLLLLALTSFLIR